MSFFSGKWFRGTPRMTFEEAKKAGEELFKQMAEAGAAAWNELPLFGSIEKCPKCGQSEFGVAFSPADGMVIIEWSGEESEGPCLRGWKWYESLTLKCPCGWTVETRTKGGITHENRDADGGVIVPEPDSLNCLGCDGVGKTASGDVCANCNGRGKVPNHWKANRLAREIADMTWNVIYPTPMSIDRLKHLHAQYEAAKAGGSS